MKTVIITGTLSYDYIMNYPGRFADRIMPDKLHVISLSFLVNKLQKQFGGTAGNIAYTLKLLQVEPLILAYGGNNFEPYKAFLSRYNLSINCIKTVKNLVTSSYFVITDTDDNQIGAFYEGATKKNNLLSFSNLPQYQKAPPFKTGMNGRLLGAYGAGFRIIKKSSPGFQAGESSQTNSDFAVIAPNTPAALKKFVSDCLRLKLKYLYDPAFQIADISRYDIYQGIKGAQIVIGNDYEIDLIKRRLAISHKQLTKLVPVLVTTLGRAGSVIEGNLAGKRSIKIKAARPKNTTDPTGAGDAYRAGFLAGYLRGFPLKICGQMGSVAAVYTVEKYGTITHFFTKTEFVRRYRENFGELLNL